MTYVSQHRVVLVGKVSGASMPCACARGGTVRRSDFYCERAGGMAGLGTRA